MSALRPLRSQAPRPCRVAVGPDGRPREVDGRAVEAVREEWRVEEGWWATPVRRRCFEVVLAGGRLCVVHEDRGSGAWRRYGG